MVQELKKTFRTLQISEQRYKLAAAGTNDGIWEWDIKADEIYISPRWKSILGYEANESVESSDYWFNHVIPEDVDALRSAFFSHIEGEFDHIEIEFRMLDVTSQIVWVSCRGLIQRDKRGKAVKLAGSISDITSRKNAENILQQQAMYDGLTGLPNRHLFVDRLNQALALQRRDSGSKLAVLFIDLDRFKTINDSLGHAAGDRLLVGMSRRFTRIVRETDTLARFGGDEYVLLLNHTDDEYRPEKIAKRLCEEAKRGFDLSGQTVFVSASIGMVNVVPQTHDAESVLRDADVAMYKAKAKGGDCFRLFDRSMHMDAVSQLQINTDLQEALIHDQLVLYYQPILDLKSGKWSGMEALIRWNHPVRGLMSPVDFIPFAEQSGLINEIGQWVMTEAIRQLSVWARTSDIFKDLTMSINVSVKQIDGELVRNVMQAVEANNVSPSQIQLEITESLVMSDFKQVINISQELKEAGIRLAMDDFGTGYSSLSYLHRLPFSALKIDRSFISVMKTRKSSDDDIVAAVIRLANNFNMKVVAEGVENRSQLMTLQELGCDYVQGYFIGKPKPASEIEAMIAQGKMFFDPAASAGATVVSIT
jgi:diguanylate cyclase (GGDEF)-like protein/PAS domain S-box-containing protein